MQTPRKQNSTQTEGPDWMKAQIVRITEEHKAKYLPTENTPPLENREGQKQKLFSSEEALAALKDDERGDARLFARMFKGKFCYDNAENRWHFLVLRLVGDYFAEERFQDLLS